jgi:hypothetical protein
MNNYKTYGYSSDNLDKRGFIDKKIILDLVTQEQIFSLVFGFLPEDFQYTTSPFRNDKTPGCWFQYYTNGVLYFIDFASTSFRRHSDCFNIVQDFFQLGNFYMTLEFIYMKLIDGKDIRSKIIMKNTIQKIERESVKLLVEPRQFNNKDVHFWNPFGITIPQLIEDKYFAISSFHALNTKKGNISSRCYDLAYVDTNFSEGRKKIYFPHRQDKSRFLTTCKREDIGGISSLAPFGRQLIITKSYKDYRVLKNQGKNVIYLQNEGMFPLKRLLIIVKSWKEVIILFDNDRQGMHSAMELAALINAEYLGKAKPLWLPETLYNDGITDPSDLHAERGQNELLNFLKIFT